MDNKDPFEILRRLIDSGIKDFDGDGFSVRDGVVVKVKIPNGQDKEGNTKHIVVIR